MPEARAQSYWSTNPTDSNLATGANWSNGVAPANNTAWVFSNSTITTLNDNFANLFTNAGITFSVGASAFTINGNSFTLGGNITNNSTSTQTFGTAMVLSAARTFTTTANGGNLVFNGVISGAFQLTVNGLGLTYLNGANTFGGGISAQSAGATLVGGNASAFGTGTITMNGGPQFTTVVLATDITDNFGNNITGLNSTGGTGRFISDRATAGGGVTHTLGNFTTNNNISSAFTILAQRGGRVTDGNAAIGVGTMTGGPVAGNGSYNLIALSAGLQINTVTWTPTTISSNNNIILAGSATNSSVVSVNNGTNGSFIQTLGIIKAGPGVWSMTGACGYTGTNQISGGTLVLDYTSNTASKLSTNTLLLAGGTIQLYGANAENITGTIVNGGQSQILQSGSALPFNLKTITFANSGSLNIGVGVVATTILGNDSSGVLSSRMTIGGGDLAMNSGSSIIAYSGYSTTGFNSTSANYIINGGTNLSVLSAKNLKITSSKGTAQTLTLTNNSALGSGSASLLYNGSDNYTISMVGSSKFGTAPLLIQQWGTGMLTMGNIGSGLEKYGNGSLTITGVAQNTSAWFVNNGSLVITNNNSINTNITATTFAVLTLNGGTLVGDTRAASFAMDNNGTNNRSIAIGLGGGSFDVLGTGTFTISGLIYGGTAGFYTAPITIGSSNTVGTIAFSAMNTFAGGINLNGGTLLLANSNTVTNFSAGVSFTTNSTTITITNGTTAGLVVGQSIYATTGFAGYAVITSIIDSTRFTISSLPGANSTNGSTININAGGVLGNFSNAAGQNYNFITFNGGTLQYSPSNSIDYSTRFSLGANQQFKINTAGQNVTFATGLSGVGSSLTKLGGGTLTLAGQGAIVPYTGSNTILGGTLKVGAANAISPGALTVTGTGATLDLGGFTITVGSLSDGGTATGSITNSGAFASLIVSNATASSFLGSIGGNLALIESGTGTLTLASNSYTGGMTLSSGQLNLNSPRALGSGTFTINGGTRIDNASAGPITLASNVQIWNGNFTFVGTQSLNLGSGSVTLGNNATVTVGASTLTVGGNIGGNYTLTKAGPGTLMLNGFNNYSGATVVNSGILLVNGTNTTSAVTVNGGGTLGGIGSLGSVTVNTGGIITSGGSNGSSIGTLNVTNLTFYDGSTYSITISGTGSAATNDLISSMGVMTFSNTIPYSITIAINADQNILGTNQYKIMSASNGFANFSPDNFNFTLNGSSSTNFTVSTSNNSLYLSYANFGSAPLTANPGITNYQSDYSYSNGISGQMNVTLSGGGEYVLNVSNSYQGTTIITSGTLTATSSNSFGSGGTIFVGTTNNGGSNAAVNINTNGVVVPNAITVQGAGTNVILNSSGGAVTYSGPIYLNTNAIMSNTAGGNLVASGIISRGGALTIGAGSGTVTLAAANTYSGGTRLNSGTLALSNSSAMGTGTLTASSNVTTALQSLANISVANPQIISTNATLVLDAAGNAFTNAGNITGPGGLGITNSTGAGTVTLSGSNSYQGGTTVNSGTLALGTNNSLWTNGTLTVTNGGLFNLNGFAQTLAGLSGNGIVTNSGSSTLTINSTFANSFGGTISGTIVLLKSGANTLTLSGINSYTGGTILTNGTLVISGSNSLGDVSGTLTFAGNSTLSVGNTFTTGRNYFISNAVAATIDTAGNNLTNTGVISGGGSLTKTGTGTLVLAGINSYTGGTTIANGTLMIGNNAALGTAGPLNMIGGVLSNDGYTVGVGSVTLGNVTIAGNGTITGTSFTATNSGALLISNSLAGTGAFTQSGTGTTTLYGFNVYNGDTFLNAGTLAIGNSNALGTGTLTVTANSTLQAATNPLSLTNAIVVIGGSTTLTMDTGANLWTNSGVISSTGAILKIGSGTLSLASNSYSGGTTLSNGTLLINGSASLGAGTGTLTFAGNSTLSVGASFSSARNYVINPNVVATINTVGNNLTNNFTNTGVISGSGSLTKIGSGTLALSGENTYRGTTTISNGVVQIGTNGTTGSISNSIVMLASNTGFLAFNRSDTLTQDSNFPIGNSTLTGAGGFIQMGSGTTILTVNNTYTGTTTVSAGVLQIGNNGTTGSISNSTRITLSGGFLAFNLSNIVTTQGVSFLTNSNAITGASGGVRLGSGTLILTAANTYTGDTVVTNGTLILSNSLAIQNSVLNLSGGTLRFATNLTNATFGGLKGTRPIALNNISDPSRPVALTLNNTNSTNTIYSGTLSGSGTLILAGAGTQTLAGSNSYTGGTILNAGTLAISTNYALGTGILANGGSAVLQAGADALNMANVVTLGSGTLSVDVQNFTFTSSGNISGTGTLAKTGNGTLILSGNYNTYSGGTLLNAGTLVIGNSFSLGTGILTVSSNATLQNAYSSLGNAIVLSGGSTTLTMDYGSGLWYNTGGISSNGALLMTGTGTLVLAASNNYSGGTTLSNGVLVINNKDALGSTNGPLNVSGGVLTNDGYTVGVGSVTLGNVTIAGNGTITGSSFTATNTDILSIYNSLAGSASFTQVGTGVTTLYSSNSYSGGTLVTAGTLFANNSNAFGTGGVTNNGGVIDLGSFQNIFTNSFSLGGGTITRGRISNDVSFSGLSNGTVGAILTGSGSLVMTNNGSGTLILSAPNNYTGGTLMSNGGTLIVAAGYPTALSTGVILLNGTNNTLDLGSYTMTNAFILNGGVITNGVISNNVVFNNLNNGTISANLIGSASLTHSSSGTLTLSGFNKYTGGNKLTGGTVKAMTTNALGAGGKTIYGGTSINNATLYVAQTNTVLTLGNGIALQGSATITLAYGSSITNIGGISITNATSTSTNAISLDSTWSFANVSGAVYNLVLGKNNGITGAKSNSIGLFLSTNTTGSTNPFYIPFGGSVTNTNSSYDQTYSFISTNTSLQLLVKDIWRPIQTIPKYWWYANTTQAIRDLATTGGVQEISSCSLRPLYFTVPAVNANASRDVSAILNGKGQVVVIAPTNSSNTPAPATNVPAAATNGVTRISAGYEHVMALKNGGVLVWPDSVVQNYYGDPIAVPSTASNGVVEISAGYYSCLALKNDGTVVGWGYKYTYTNGLPAPSWTFNAGLIVSQLRNVKGIADGYLNGLALLNDGTVRGFGQSFNSSKISEEAEVMALGLTNVAAISIGQTFAMALKNDKTVVAWGKNDLGQTSVPADLTNVVSISAGSDYALALKSDGTVVSWGNTNFYKMQTPIGFAPVAAIEAARTYALVARTNNGITPLDDCHTAGGMKGGGGGMQPRILPLARSTPVPRSTPAPTGSSSSSGSTQPFRAPQRILPAAR